MQIGLALPSSWGLPDPHALVDVSVQAEQLGFDAIWMGEHVLNSGYIAERLGDAPYYGMLAMLSFIAARTSRIKLGTSVLVMPNHHPMTLAKFVATLDHLSNGRLILGIGCGGNEAEFEAMGLDFAGRGEETNEMLAVMEALFTQKRASHHGKRWNFDNVIFSPKPLQTPFPIWVGGTYDSPPSLRRTARYGTGWQPSGLGPEKFAAAAEKVRKMAAEAGRDPKAIAMSATLTIDHGEKISAVERSTILSADLDTMVKQLAVWQRLGLDDMVLRLNLRDIDTLRKTVNQIGTVVLPRLREREAA